MTQETNNALSWLAQLIGIGLGVVGGGIAGGLAGAIAAHRLAFKRERDKGRSDRRREFCSFVVEFKSEAADPYSLIMRDTYGRGFSNLYQSKKAQLVKEAAKITRDLPFKRRAQFDSLVNAAAGFVPEKLDPFKDRQDLLVPALDAILKFLDKAYRGTGH